MPRGSVEWPSLERTNRFFKLLFLRKVSIGLAFNGGLTWSSRNLTVVRPLEMCECWGSNVTINGMFFSVTGRGAGSTGWISQFGKPSFVRPVAISWGTS